MRPDGAALPVSGVRLSLWRAAAVYRVITLVVALYLIGRWHDLYSRTWVAVAVGVAMTAGTAAVCRLALTGRAHRTWVVASDVVVTAGLTLATLGAQSPHQRHGDMPTLTTFWGAGPALEAGILLMAAGGVIAGLAQFAVVMIVRDGYDGRTLGSGVLLIVAGGVVGYVASLAVRAEDELRVVTAERAALAERERLARSVHDGVLQVLGLVVSRTEGELAVEAARQEAALRALINTAAPVPSGTADIVGLLGELRGARVTVSGPAAPVVLAAADAAELAAAVRVALANVDRHAGPDARAWVLVERDATCVRITVRDDGVGMPVERLAEAARDGRLGVASSIQGRTRDLGGTVRITSVPGGGTTVEMTVPDRAPQ